jgi:glyceraldehyde 3-phosphate dehydrogenase
LEAMSYRVPTDIVSVIDFTAMLSRDSSREEIVELFTDYANNALAGIIHCEYGSWGHQKASIDYLSTQYSAIILMQHLTLNKQRHLGLALMHDNEYAYCHRVLDVLGVIAAHPA